MQKIIVRNFNAVENAEIEVKKVLVLIGEQASGKSTIAKLIYFFKSLRDDLFNQIYKADKEEFDKLEDLIYQIRTKFYNFFGSTFHLQDFEIYYYYNEEKNKFLKLSLDSRKKLQVDIKNFLSPEFALVASQLKKILYNNLDKDIHEQLNFEQTKLRYAQRLSNLVNELFESNQTDSLFLIAGRSATVSYSELFEKYLFASIQNKVEENNQQKVLKRKQQTIEETLMLSFIERIEKLKSIFKRFGDFDELIETYAENNADKEKLYKIRDKINELLKGKYVIDDWGEKLVFSKLKNDYIYLSNASSGQQEAIRIVQDIFLSILDKVKILRIIEEPEAHLFPIAQKQMIELLSLMVNLNSENQIVITTHSPYVLTVFNNLLFASRVAEKNLDSIKDIADIIPNNIWLKSADFSAYSLDKQTSEDVEYCISIMDKKTGLIEQNYLDVVSEMLGNNFNELYKIHSKSFARR